MASVIDAILRLKDEFTPTLQNVTSKLDEHEKAQKRLSNQYIKTGNTISSFGAKIAMISAPLEAAAMAGLKLHAEFASGMEKVGTLIDKSTTSLQKLSEGVRKVSDETGIAVTDLAESEYQAISAGVDAANVTQFLDTVTKASIAGYADSTTAINGVTTVLNSYGMAASEASKITDEMLITQNLGKTTFGELAQSIGNVTPLAKTLGVTTEELFGSLASLTKNGIQTSEAITGLRAAFTNIIKPSSNAGKMAQQLGLDFSAAHLKSVGWAKFLDEIKEKTGGNLDTMAQLFGSVQGLNAVLSLTGEGSKDFTNALKAMGDQAGITDRVFDELMKKDPTKAMQLAVNQLKNAGMDLGGSLAPLLTRASKMTKELAKILRELTPAERDFIMVVGQGIIVFGVATAGIGKMITTYGTLRKSALSAYKAVKDAGSIEGAILKQLPVLNRLGAGTKVAAEGTKGLLASLGNSVNAAFSAMTHPVTTFRSIFSSALEAAGRTVTRFMAAISGVPEAIGNVVKNAVGFITRLPSALMSVAGRIVTFIRNPIASFRTLFTVIRTGFTAVRALMAANPIGLALLAISVAVLFVVRNFNTFRQVATTVFNHVQDTISKAVNTLAPIFNRLWQSVQNAMNKIADALGFGESATEQSSASVTVTINTLGSVFSFVFDVIAGVVTTAVGVIANVLSTAINVFSDVIEFLNDVFVGDWEGAWDKVKQIFTDIVDGIKNTFTDMINSISGMIDRIIGRSKDAKEAASEAGSVDEGTSGSSGNNSWTGTSWFPGGTTWIHEQGPEIVKLPTGAQVVPHSESMELEYKRGMISGMYGGKNVNINIASIADTIVVRDKQDINEIANQLAFKLKQYAINRMDGAVI